MKNSVDINIDRSLIQTEEQMLARWGEYDKPLVSINCITYNHEQFIRDALDSFLMQQTDFPFEIIIHDDASTDATADIIREYEARYPVIIKPVYQTENQYSQGKRVGLLNAQRAQGEYIAFCEGDDYWHHPNKLKMQKETISKHKDCGLVYSDYDIYSIKNKKRISNFIRYKKKNPPSDPTLVDLFDGKTGIITCTVFLKRMLINSIIDSDPYLYKKNKFKMGDTQLWAAMIYHSKVFYIDTSTATRNYRPESLTKSKDIYKVLAFRKNAAELLVYLARKYSLPEEICSKYVEKLKWVTLRCAFIKKDIILADNTIKEMLSPSLIDKILYFSLSNHFLYFFLKKIIEYRMNNI